MLEAATKEHHDLLQSTLPLLQLPTCHQQYRQLSVLHCIAVLLPQNLTWSKETVNQCFNFSSATNLTKIIFAQRQLTFLTAEPWQQLIEIFFFKAIVSAQWSP